MQDVLQEARPIIELHNVSLRLNAQLILENIQLQIFPKQICTIIGPNGGGKTSLVKVLLGLISPTLGCVYHADALRLGYVPQKWVPNLHMPMTVSRFLRLGARKVSDSQIKQALNEVTADYLFSHSLPHLSGGELQRVLLARAILQNPDVLVLDEPLAGVDILGQEEIYRLIKHIRDRTQCAIILVSHDLHFVMASTDTVICLNRHICCSGHPHAIHQDPAFKQLFPNEKLGEIAIYQHAHDHHHHLDGHTDDAKHDH